MKTLLQFIENISWQILSRRETHYVIINIYIYTYIDVIYYMENIEQAENVFINQRYLIIWQNKEIYTYIYILEFKRAPKSALSF